MQLLDDAIVFGVILKSASSVDDAGYTEPIHLSHEVTTGVLLVLLGQFWALRERCIQNGRVGLSQKQTGRIAIAIAHDLATGRARCGLVVTHRTKRRAIQQRAIVQMHNEHRGIWGDGIQLVNGWEPLLSKLMLGESADDPHPLWCRRAIHLGLEHPQRCR